MNKKMTLISVIAVSVFTFSTVFAQSVQIHEGSQSETAVVSTRQKLRGLRDMTIQSGTSSTGGGGVRKIRSDSFPDKVKLEQIVQLIKEKIANVNLPREFKTVFLDELNYLYTNDKIRTVPALLAHIGDGQFNSYSGRSGNLPRQEIILSWFEHSQKNIEDSASNVAHEVIHNITSEVLVADETYLEDLEKSIMTGVVTSDILRALKYGIYLAHGQIYYRQFFALVFDADHPNLKKAIGVYLSPLLGSEKNENRQAYEKLTAEFIKALDAKVKHWGWGVITKGSSSDFLASQVFLTTNALLEVRDELFKSGKFSGLSEAGYHYVKEIHQSRSYRYYLAAAKLVASVFLEKLIEFNPEAAKYKDFVESDYQFGCTKYKEFGYFSSKSGYCEEWIPLANYLIPGTPSDQRNRKTENN